MTPADLTPDTMFSFPLLVLCGFVGALIAATWRAANYLRDIKADTKGIRRDLASSVRHADFKDWAHQLERENRGVERQPERGLFVPDFQPTCPVPEREDA